MIMIILSISRPPPKPPAEEPLGMPVLGAVGGVALGGEEEDLAQDVEEDGMEDSWQDSSACSPLPGDPAPLVKTKVNRWKEILATCATGNVRPLKVHGWLRQRVRWFCRGRTCLPSLRRWTCLSSC